MGFEVDFSFSLIEASIAAEAMRAYIAPIVTSLCMLAGLVCTLFLVHGGVQYMASSGDPNKLEQAKKIIKNALIGLILVIGATTITALLTHEYSNIESRGINEFPVLQAIEPSANGGLATVLIGAVIELLRSIIQSVGEPFLSAIDYFIRETPLMANNSSVFNLWLAVVGIADVLFVLVVSLVGFQIMSFSALGMDEVDLKNFLPQLVLVFLLINSSIFAIDVVIGLSNAMITALRSGFPSVDIWVSLADITRRSSDLNMAGLLVMIAFLVLSIMLLVFYVGRLITLYIGAILSPLILLMWLIPAFKDFALTAFKTYLTVIFILFVHVVILLLATSIFMAVSKVDAGRSPDTFMALILGLATVMALLKTQGVMQELSYVSSAPRAARELSGQFIRAVSSLHRAGKSMTGIFPVGSGRSLINSRLVGRSLGDVGKSTKGGK